MAESKQLDAELARELERNRIDAELTFRILANYNSGRYDAVEPVLVRDLPSIDGKTILDLTGELVWTIPLERAKKALARYPELALAAEDFGRRSGAEITFTRSGLERLGMRLLPLVGFGILNGGSATSYADYKKNAVFGAKLLEITGPVFERMGELTRGRAKGLTPGFLQPDGTPGASYIELKMRALLLQVLRYQQSAGKHTPGLLPLFQMTSVNNTEEVLEAYRGYRASPLLSELVEATRTDVTDAETGIQPLVAAYTHSSLGRPKRLFTEAYGRPGAVLPLPGGHGQNFSVLREIYRALRSAGKRFVQLGNVDNLGNTLDLAELALLALSGKQAGFDFAFKTPIDVKGGILIVDQHNRLDCADIGPAISHQEVHHAESLGKDILFNCATGLFNLDYLTDNIDEIIDKLPMRWSDQDKDAGHYSQAEQVTWEIIGMLDDFFIFGVEKKERFLAAKLLLECLMTSGIGLERPDYPSDPVAAKSPRHIAEQLNEGLAGRLSTVYGMERVNGRWEPKPVARLIKEIGS